MGKNLYISSSSIFDITYLRWYFLSYVYNKLDKILNKRIRFHCVFRRQLRFEFLLLIFLVNFAFFYNKVQKLMLLNLKKKSCWGFRENEKFIMILYGFRFELCFKVIYTNKNLRFCPKLNVPDKIPSVLFTGNFCF